MGLAETAELAVRISLKDNVSGGIRKLQGNLGGLNRSLAQTGRGVGQIGTGLARAGLLVGGAAIAGIVAAGKAAVDFQDAFAGVRKTVNETELTAVGLSFDKLALSFRKMATEIPIAATEFARIGEAAGALGVNAKDIEAFTKTVALLGVTTNLTTDEAAESLGKIGTILNLTGQQYTDFADILVNLGNKGASTEAEIIEITKRFAASGRQAGLSIPQILAYASAIASAGAEPEAAGSSLSRLFGNLITETARATAKGKAFAEVTGKSFKDFSAIVENDTNGAMISFLKSLSKLDKFGQQKALKAVGITNVRDRNAILLLARTIDTNLIPAFENAENASGALGTEATKRFDTIASKIQVLKQNLVEAGITIGEGFLPALGRATEKLTAFLQVDANKSRLKAIGEDIGRAIDGINWADVLTGATKFVDLLKGALSFAKLLFDAFMALPGPIKEATAGFLVLNKLSGNLLAAGAGNVIGGLAGAATVGLASRAPGVGRLFAQPVFVTNFPPGFGAGGALGAGAAATSIWSKIGRVIGGAFLIATAAELADVIHSAVSPGGGLEGRTRGEGGGLLAGDQLMWPFGPKNTPRIDLGPFKNVLGGDSAFTSGEMLGPPTPRGWENLGSQKLGPPAPGRTGGASLEDRTDAGNAIRAGILQRAVEAGFHPTGVAIERTLSKNNQHLIDIRNAVLGLNRAGFYPPKGGGGPPKVDNTSPKVNSQTGFSFATGAWRVPYDMAANIHSGEMVLPATVARAVRGGSVEKITVKITQSVKDTSNAQVIRSRFGKTSTQAGAA